VSTLVGLHVLGHVTIRLTSFVSNVWDIVCFWLWKECVDTLFNLYYDLLGYVSVQT